MPLWGRSLRAPRPPPPRAPVRRREGGAGPGRGRDCGVGTQRRAARQPFRRLSEPPGVVVSVLTFLFWGDKVVCFEFNVFGVSEKWGDQSIPRSARALDLGSENSVRILPTAGPRAILFVRFCSRGFLKFPFVLPGRQ